MNTEMIFSNIYPEMHLQDELPHPVTGKVYRKLTDAKLINLANSALVVLLRSGIKQILVAESGAVPFAKICAWIAHKKNLGLQWYSIKIPRNIKETILPAWQTYLSLSMDELKLTHELDHQISGFSSVGNTQHHFLSHFLPENYFDSRDLTLYDILSSLQNKMHLPLHHYYLEMSQSTGLAKILDNPFIFFDEYIDSGKTLFQSFRFFNLFGKSLRFKVFSYLIKLHQIDFNQEVCESLYTLDNEHEAYQLGIYPFENRIDWLGYYYLSTEDKFQKIPIAELCLPNSHLSLLQQNYSSSELLNFIQLCTHETLLKDVKGHCRIPEISQWITHKHLVQYSLYRLEEICIGKNEFSEFLYQLFDMYGPLWSPLPDNYHLCYLDAFEEIGQKINQLFSTESINKEYQRIRKKIMHHISHLFEKRRVNQQHHLLITLEKYHAS